MDRLLDEAEQVTLLHTFYDALEAGKVCQQLEEAGIPFSVEDLGHPTQGIDRFSERPPIRLDIIVSKHDLVRAQDHLRATMHLFPTKEVDDPLWQSPLGDDDIQRTEVAVCESRADAEAVQKMLEGEGIWSTICPLVDEAESDSVQLSVEVRCEDIDRAMLAVEKWAQ